MILGRMRVVQFHYINTEIEHVRIAPYENLKKNVY